jgi:hypothetical protein
VSEPATILIDPAEFGIVANPRELHAALVERHGGRAALSPVDMELIWSLTKVFVGLRNAPAGDVPKLIESVSRIEAMLPSPGKASLSPLDALEAHCARVPS